MKEKLNPAEQPYHLGALRAALVAYNKYREAMEHLERAAILSKESVQAFRDAQDLESCTSSGIQWGVPFRLDTVYDLYERVIPQAAAINGPVRSIQAELTQRVSNLS